MSVRGISNLLSEFFLDVFEEKKKRRKKKGRREERTGPNFLRSGLVLKEPAKWK